MFSKIIPLSIIQSLFLCGGQVLLKIALTESGPFSWTWRFFKDQLTNWWFLGCGVSFGLATMLWMFILKHFPFSIAYPLSCMSYIFGMIAALIIFRESVSLQQWLGVFMIVIGCILISR